MLIRQQAFQLSLFLFSHLFGETFFLPECYPKSLSVRLLQVVDEFFVFLQRLGGS